LALPLAVVMIAPFLYMVATALMSEPDSLRHPVPKTSRRRSERCRSSASY